MATQKELIEYLSTANLAEESIESISEILNQISEISATSFTIDAGVPIVRVRRGKGYRTVKDLSYPDAKYCSNIQRATLPYETGFYGCISDDKNRGEKARFISITECATLARKDSMHSIGREDITCATWITKRRLRVISLISDLTFPQVTDNLFLNVLREQYIKHLPEISAENRELDRLLNREFTKRVEWNESDKEYLISASVSHNLLYFMMDENKRPYDAIIYPSVTAGGQGGVDILIKPEVADEALDLYLIGEQTFFKRGPESLIRIDAIYDASGKCICNVPQFPDCVVCEKMGLNSIDDLPIVSL